TRAVRRSRVTPAVGSTMAIRRPASQLNSDDLPTFGRPTIATRGIAFGVIITLLYYRRACCTLFPESRRILPDALSYSWAAQQPFGRIENPSSKNSPPMGCCGTTPLWKAHMIIVLRPHSTQAQIDHILERIQEPGLRPHMSQGELRTIIGVIGGQ